LKNFLFNPSGFSSIVSNFIPCSGERNVFVYKTETRSDTQNVFPY